MRHIVTDKANNDCVPENGGWFRNCVKQLAGKMGLALFAKVAEAGANSGSFDGL